MTNDLCLIFDNLRLWKIMFLCYYVKIINLSQKFFALLKIFASLGNWSKLCCSRLSQKFSCEDAGFVVAGYVVFVGWLADVCHAGHYLFDDVAHFEESDLVVKLLLRLRWRHWGRKACCLLYLVRRMRVRDCGNELCRVAQMLDLCIWRSRGVRMMPVRV